MTDQNSTLPDAVLSSDQIETIAPGITCQWLDDRQIAVFTIGTVARASIDALLEKIRVVLTDWPADRPYLAVYQLAESPDGPTPYIRERFRDMPKWRPGLKAHIAIIATRSFQGRLVQLYTQARGNAARIFFRREDGIAWLRGFCKVASDPGHDKP